MKIKWKLNVTELCYFYTTISLVFPAICARQLLFYLQMNMHVRFYYLAISLKLF